MEITEDYWRIQGFTPLPVCSYNGLQSNCEKILPRKMKLESILLVIHQGVGTPISTVLRAMTGIVTRNTAWCGWGLSYFSVFSNSHTKYLSWSQGHWQSSTVVMWSQVVTPLFTTPRMCIRSYYSWASPLCVYPLST